MTKNGFHCEARFFYGEFSMLKSRDDCKRLLERFVKERLNGDLNALKTFCTSDLAGDRQFGARPDGDDKEISRAVYFLVWGGVLPCYERPDQIGIGRGMYRGDTLNTFNSLFGKDLRRAKERISEPRLIKKIEAFKREYCTVGNYMLLPNSRAGKTLNTYRGGYFGWRDYFDRFLSALKQSLACGESGHPRFDEIVRANDWYFQDVDFKRFCEINFLDGYLNEAGAVVMYSDNQADYAAFAEAYIAKSRKIIADRAEKIVSALDRQA